MWLNKKIIKSKFAGRKWKIKLYIFPIPFLQISLLAEVNHSYSWIRKDIMRETSLWLKKTEHNELNRANEAIHHHPQSPFHSSPPVSRSVKDLLDLLSLRLVIAEHKPNSSWLFSLITLWCKLLPVLTLSFPFS